MHGKRLETVRGIISSMEAQESMGRERKCVQLDRDSVHNKADYDPLRN